MTDLRLLLEDKMFALRAGILCVQGGRLLVIRGEGSTLSPYGAGRVEFSPLKLIKLQAPGSRRTPSSAA
ncbi:hypothetical protein ACINK0_10365 [Deinococcus sp. VB343]|uniref:hypothetical protein n=1 Tax=Deinococcus sp. VB343 TaxID=3385567 RepID=UPI0039C92D1E